MAHRSTFLLTLAFPLATHAQNLVSNGDFESGGNFDISGWNWFCSVPEYFPSLDACNGSYALGIPPNDSLSTCFSNGELVGLHTHLVGMQAGVPYELTFCEMVDPNIGGDIGIFAVPAGQTPTSFDAVTLVSTWPVSGVPGTWVQDNIDFTVPLAYVGMDLYLFVEYSAAPDVLPTMKFFDNFNVTDQTSLGTPEYTANALHIFPDPASDRIFSPSFTKEMSADVLNISGRVVKSVRSNREGMIDITDLPVGVYSVRAGDRMARFVKQ